MKSRLLKGTAIFLVVTIVTEILYPTAAYALTGGPAQPETQTFQPAGTSEMVDLFSGDFSYNIPVLDVGGYPVNLSYNSNIAMDQEASWCGLGWNINLGAINRTVRGIPDEFKGDQVTKRSNLKTNETYGVTITPNIQIFGLKKEKKPVEDLNKLNISIGLSYNNYNGYGFDLSANPSITVTDGAKGSLNLGLGLSASSESGVGITPTVSFASKLEKKNGAESKISTNIGVPFNSRAGLSALTMQTSVSAPSYQFKNVNIRMAHNGGGQISFATPSFTPQISMPMTSFGLTFAATLGGAIFGLHGNIELGGYYSRQELKEKSRTLPAYGYLFAHESEAHVRGNVMLDFNREKDGSFSKSTPNLPLTNLTYDVYSVAGQGVGGTYRPFRGDIGTVYDPYTTTDGTSTQLPGVELGGGNVVHVGTNFTFVNNTGHSGRWIKDNESKEYFAFQKERPDTKLYEPAYFKQVGEKTVDSDPERFNALGGFDPIRIELGNADPGSARAIIVNNNNQKVPVTPNANTLAERTRRNQVWGFLNADEAGIVGLQTQIHSYSSGNFSMNAKGEYSARSSFSRKAAHRLAHHISETTVIRPDGTRYVYGIPTYNKLQKEVSFAASGAGDCANGLVSYGGSDATTNNRNGIDNFFEEITTPPYATSYLLTAIVSHDYIDVTEDGPSDDDLGTYTKFNYSNTASNYRWRVPFEAGKANYSEGLKSDPYDDKGNYLYGEKELWYVHSIETKTHVAEFYLSNRTDGFGVQGEAGGRGTQTMQKLDRIELYAKPDRAREKSGTSPGYKATPIKVVHFVYDYSLCPGIPNSSTGEGKLTLKEVFFTYQHSNRGKFSPYRFNYEGENPRYNLKAYDRWGNYKPNAQDGACGTEDVTTGEFPYVEQNKLLADRYSSAWQLTSIQLPSGGKIIVDYESDDYAYVQDKKAMQMFTIEGIGNSLSDSPVSGRKLSGRRYLFFRLQEPLTPELLKGMDPSEYVRRNYLGDILNNTLYFKFFVDLDNKRNYEYVPGYAKVASAGAVQTGGNYTHGYVELRGVGVEANDSDGGENPIQKASWQFARLQRPDIVYGDESKPGSGNIVGLLKAMASSLDAIVQTVRGINRYMRDKAYGNDFVPHKSVIRLYNTSGFKYGGGSRVKRIAMSDEWSALSNNVDERSAEYGQEYDYTTTIGIGAQQHVVSSGVAAYEPILGGDENPFRQAVSFSTNKLLAPDDKYYLEEPFGEMFFPGPQVGYSKVIVKNLQHQNVRRNATGYVVNEFYTAKDFPTIVKQTSLASKPYKPSFLLTFLKVKVREYMTASQGYVVELNDMHGKQKAQWVYAEGKIEPISGVEYFYKKDTPEGNRLNNEVYTITKHVGPDGKRVRLANVGVDYDVVTDMREQENTSETSGIGGNLDTFFAAIFPAVVPVVLPKYSKEETRFRSAVITKVINRYGLIDKVVAHDLGSSVQTKNLLYDAETGEILLTETQNQFDDPVYSFTYPAHWAYEGMGMAYKNIGLEVVSEDFNGQNDYLKVGDEVVNNNQRAWVLTTSPYYFELIDENGNLLDAEGEVKVVRSGRRNQQTTQIGTVTSLSNPLTDANGDGMYDGISFTNPAVLNASAVIFDGNISKSCSCISESEMENFYGRNTFITGENGIWRLAASYTFLTDREITRLNDNPHVRKDGTYKDFSPFWSPPGGSGDWYQNYGWTLVSEVTQYNQTGNEVENKDALGRYSSALYGYSQTLPKAVANNSTRKEIGFDGFEDYDNAGCEDDHFSFQEFKTNVSEEDAHSGRKSIKVPPNSSVEIIKDFECPFGEYEGGGGGENP